MGDDRTWEYAWIHGHYNYTMDNGTLSEASGNCPIQENKRLNLKSTQQHLDLQLQNKFREADITI